MPAIPLPRAQHTPIIYENAESASSFFISPSVASSKYPEIREFYFSALDSRMPEGLFRTVTIRSPLQEMHNLVKKRDIGMACPLSLDNVIEMFELGESAYVYLARDAAAQGFENPPLFFQGGLVLAGDFLMYAQRVISALGSYISERHGTKTITYQYCDDHDVAVPSMDAGKGFTGVESLRSQYIAIRADLEKFVAGFAGTRAGLASKNYSRAMGYKETMLLPFSRARSKQAKKAKLLEEGCLSWNDIARDIIPEEDWKDTAVRKERLARLRYCRRHIEELLKKVGDNQFVVPAVNADTVRSFLYEENKRWAVRPINYNSTSIGPDGPGFDYIKHYIREAGEHPLFSAEEERAIAEAQARALRKMSKSIFSLDAVADAAIQLARAVVDKKLSIKWVFSEGYETIGSCQLLSLAQVRRRLPDFIENAGNALYRKRMLSARRRHSSMAKDENALVKEIDAAREEYAEYCSRIPFDVVMYFLKVINEAKYTVEEEQLAAHSYRSPVLSTLESIIEERTIKYKNGKKRVQLKVSDFDKLMEVTYPFGNEDEACCKRLLEEIQESRKEYVEKRNEFASGNLRLVIFIAKKYRGLGLDFVDLIEEGNRGLMKGIAKYDYKMGYKASTYLTWWIKQNIRRAISDQLRTVRLPVHVIESIKAIHSFESGYAQTHDREPSIEEIAKGTNLKVCDVERVRNYYPYAVSFDAPFDSSAKKPRSVGDAVADIGDTPQNSVDKPDLRERVGKLLETLTPREAEILRLRFGIGNDGVMYALEDIGKKMHLSRERIRQIEAKAIKKLGHPSRSRQLEGFVDDDNSYARTRREEYLSDGNKKERRRRTEREKSVNAVRYKVL